VRPARAGAFAFAAAFVFCVITSAARWHVAVTLPAAAVSFVGAVACVVRLRLHGGRGQS
jgi:hypothetical protein